MWDETSLKERWSSSMHMPLSSDVVTVHPRMAKYYNVDLQIMFPMFVDVLNILTP